MELRTKSVNIKEALQYPALPNVIYSFSISTNKSSKNIDRKTPPLSHRLKAIKKLQEKGHPIGLHLDPVIWNSNWSDEHTQLIHQLGSEINLGEISYISLGVVRFTENVYHQFKKKLSSF